ncbi:hypothetical protein GBP346_A2201 [Burkholderia pseudomallei MSHR346]|nr:hypothetical protein GBP346_A2201 [Burkholderia pseudomallei MSHR346]
MAHGIGRARRAIAADGFARPRGRRRSDARCLLRAFRRANQPGVGGPRSAAIRFDRIARALSRTDRGGGGRGMRGRHTGAGTACERWRHTVTGRRIGGNRMASSVAAVIARPRAGLTIVRVR